MNEPQTKFSEWALVEIMGHKRIVGKVSEQVIAGQGLLRVDVPEVNGNKAFTQFYGMQSIYCISPTTEALAMRMIQQWRPEPVSQFDLAQLAEKTGPKDSDLPNYCPDCQELEENCTCND